MFRALHYLLEIEEEEKFEDYKEGFQRFVVNTFPKMWDVFYGKDRKDENAPVEAPPANFDEWQDALKVLQGLNLMTDMDFAPDE